MLGNNAIARIFEHCGLMTDWGFNQRLFDVKGETIGIAIHENVNNHIPFLQRCPLAIDLRGFEMELVP